MKRSHTGHVRGVLDDARMTSVPDTSATMSNAEPYVQSLSRMIQRGSGLRMYAGSQHNSLHVRYRPVVWVRRADLFVFLPGLFTVADVLQRELDRLLHSHVLAFEPERVELRFGEHRAESTHELSFFRFLFVRWLTIR
jgi:hypothetical protein